MLARWKIRPRLMGMPGVANVANVANVAIWGQRERQRVHLDPAAVAKIRAAPPKLDKRAYTSTKGLYNSTPPARAA